MFDLVGEEIKVGSLIAFSKGNESVLKIGIVTEIHYDQINYPIKSVKHTYEAIPRKKKARKRKTRGMRGGPSRRILTSEDCVRKSYIKIEEGSDTQGRIVVIKNPMFLLNNPNIAAQLEIMDMAKDAGILPKNYELGVPIGMEN